jgi:hypothetical protein
MFFFWHKRENHSQIRNKLVALGREDLIDKLITEKKNIFALAFKERRKEIDTLKLKGLK